MPTFIMRAGKFLQKPLIALDTRLHRELRLHFRSIIFAFICAVDIRGGKKQKKMASLKF